MKVLTTNLPQGAVVDIDFGLFTHRALVSSRFGHGGKPMLISATKRTGTVLEEHWDTVVQGKPVTVVSHPPSSFHGLQFVSRARQFIRRWRYQVSDANCEHFVSMVITGRPSSAQMQGWMAFGVFALLAAGVVYAARRG